MTMLFNKRIWIGIAFIALIIGLRFSGVGDYITLAHLQEGRFALVEYVDGHYAWAVFAFILWYISVVALALPLAALSTIAGGFVFGVIPATFYASIGATIGGTFFFLLVRYAFGTVLQERYAARLQWFNTEMETYGVFYLIAIRFFALIPLFIVNLLIGLTKAPIMTFIWTTFFGMIPGAFVYAFAGQQLGTIDSLRDLFSPQVLLAFGLLALLAVVPLLAKKYGWLKMG
ncbi:MAG: hypothetical protein ACD_64C00343G0004 [uncultured bacterium]|nr:MAG: hypothetical protein ACD_64C00343G0004 [uncultured bacterium]